MPMPPPLSHKQLNRIAAAAIEAVLTGQFKLKAHPAGCDEVVVVEELPGQPGYADRVAAATADGVTVLEAPVDWTALVAATDLLVPSPGVRPTHPVMVAARAAGVAV